MYSIFNIMSLTIYELEEFRKEIGEFYKRFSFFSNIEIGDKLCKNSENEIEINKSSYYQCVTRMLYGETKITTLQYIRDLRNEYYLFLKKMIQIVNDHEVSYAFENVLLEVLSLNNIIERGLDILNKTYEDFMELQNLTSDIKNNFALFTTNVKKGKY